MAMAMRRSSIPFLSLRRLSTAVEPSSPSPTPASDRRRPPKQFFDLKTSICEESDPEKILQLFQSSAHLPGFHDDRFIYRVSVDKCFRARRQDLVERILESPKSDPNAPKTEGFYIRIMSLYNYAAMPDHALRTFEQIPSPTEKSVCTLLDGYLQQRRYDRLRELFDSIPTKHGIVYGIFTHNILLAAVCEEGDVQKARKMLDEILEKKEVIPNIVSYNTLLNAYLKKGDDAGFDDMLKVMSKNEVNHNIITYNLRILNLCKRKESLKAEELLDELVSKGITPRPTTFTAIIKGLCKEGDLSSAVRVLDRMKNMKKKSFLHAPDVYVELITAFVQKEDFTSALPICKEFLDRDASPPFGVLKTLVQGLVKDSKTEEAKDLVVKVRKVASRFASEPWAKVEAELAL